MKKMICLSNNIDWDVTDEVVVVPAHWHLEEDNRTRDNFFRVVLDNIF